MDWNALLTIGAIVLFVVLMMRGCGGVMAGGGCGMGAHSRQPRRADTDGARDHAGAKHD
jgi:hypothetical protein